MIVTNVNHNLPNVEAVSTFRQLKQPLRSPVIGVMLQRIDWKICTYASEEANWCASTEALIDQAQNWESFFRFFVVDFSRACHMSAIMMLRILHIKDYLYLRSIPFKKGICIKDYEPHHISLWVLRSLLASSPESLMQPKRLEPPPRGEVKHRCDLALSSWLQCVFDLCQEKQVGHGSYLCTVSCRQPGKVTT